MFDCLRYCLERQPTHSATVSMIPHIVRQACDIYLGQVRHLEAHFSESMASVDIYESVNRLQCFKETLEVFPQGSPGEQVLIWASFMAASACLLEEHKVFFEQFFMRQYARSRFKNLERGLEALRKIWARSPEERWTALLPQARLFVM